jgi:hypothetical protein
VRKRLADNRQKWGRADSWRCPAPRPQTGRTSSCALVLVEPLRHKKERPLTGGILSQEAKAGRWQLLRMRMRTRQSCGGSSTAGTHNARRARVSTKQVIS